MARKHLLDERTLAADYRRCTRTNGKLPKTSTKEVSHGAEKTLIV
jgi:hypothetical protein